MKRVTCAPTFNNKPITVYGDGLQTRSFSDVRDTVTALLLQADGTNGEIVNVGSDKECTILHLANLVREKAKSKSEIVYMSYKDAYGVPFVNVKRRQPDLTKLKRLRDLNRNGHLKTRSIIS